MADKLLKVSPDTDQDFIEFNPITTSAGAGDSGKVLSLDANGLLSLTFFPTGIGPAVVSLVTTEALAAGDFVNKFDDSGAFKVRKADGTNKYPAHGFVLESAIIAASVVVHFDGINNQVSGAIPGECFLSTSTAGGYQQTKTSTSDTILQKIGMATSATSIVFEEGLTTLRA